MSIEDDTLDELVKALKRVDNKALAVQIKKGESYLDYLSRERQKHFEHIQDLKSILELRIRFSVEEEEARKILEKKNIFNFDFLIFSFPIYCRIMANQLQIQNKINNGLKRILGSFRQYKLVDTIEEGDILLAFYENDPEYFDVIFIDDEVKNAVKNSENTIVICLS